MRFSHACGQKPLEGYVVKRGVARGGFGEVYFGLSDGGKEVALKCLMRDRDIELRGIRHCLNLKHPHLVHLYDLKQDDQGRDWLIMEYVRGESLAHMLRRYPNGLDRDLVVEWFSQIASAVHHLHEHGIVHRDLKPGNVFLEDGQVKVGDYGLCKFTSASRREGHTRNVGSVHYMAPEIGRGEYTRNIDVYSAGVLLHEMLVGTLPFDGETAGEILLKHLSHVPDLTALGPFAPVVARAIAKKPEERYASLAEMARAVREAAGLKASTAPTAASPRAFEANPLTSPGPTTRPPSTPSGGSDAPSAAAPKSWGELARSLVLAACLALVGSLTYAWLLMWGEWQRTAPAFFLAVATAWTVMLANRLWRRRSDDSLGMRLLLGGAGVGLGVLAVWLEGYAMTPTPGEIDALAAHSRPSTRHPFFGALYADNRWLSVLVGHVAYYGLMLAALRWWRLADVRRSSRFAVEHVLACAFWAFVLLFLLPTADERRIGFSTFVLAAVVTQVACPRREPDPAPSKRLRLRTA